jgi:hypothetical protein
MSDSSRCQSNDDHRYIDEQFKALRDLIVANDLRYSERATAQNEAIHKTEATQLAYNASHNDLLKENRRISDGFAEQLEKLRAELIGHTIYATDQRRIDERITALDKTLSMLQALVTAHVQLAMHPGGELVINDIRKEQQRQRELEVASEGRSNLTKEQRSQRNWSVSAVITVTFGTISIAISALLLILRALGL